MVDSRRDYEVAAIFSFKKETAYNTAVLDASMTKSMMFRGPDVVDRAPTVDTDGDEFGKGHEFETRQNLLAWDAKAKRSCKATAEMLGWVAAFGLGAVVDSQPNLPLNPTVYDHECTPLLAATSKQLASTSIIEKLSSFRQRKYTGVVINDFTISGEGTKFVDLEFNWIGSGAQTSNALAMPTIIPGHFLWTHSSKLEIGPYGGAFVDYSSYLKKFSVKWNNNLLTDVGYFPGSGYATVGDPTSGAIRGRLEMGKRMAEFSATVLVSSDQMKADLEANAKLKAKLTLAGEVITGGQPEVWQAVIDLAHMKYSAVPVGFDNGQEVYNITAKVLYDDATSTPIKITVTNTDIAYLT